MDIIWISSYPKSGNTWVRFFLYAWMHGTPSSSRAIGAVIPDIHKSPSLEGFSGNRLLCKTHFAMGDQHPARHMTRGFIYVLRHPRDVMLSNLNFARMNTSGPLTHHMERAWIVDYLAHQGLPAWIERRMGTWPQHVESWIGAPAWPHLILRYEDMLRNPEGEFLRVLEYLGETPDRDRLENAIRQSSFESMQALEETEKAADPVNSVFGGTPDGTRAGFRFMNAGKTGQRLHRIGADLDRRFDERFGEAMRRWGYAP